MVNGTRAGRWGAALLCAAAAAWLGAAPRPAAIVPAPPALNPALPTVFVAGDSTAQNSTAGALGWGKPFADFFDPAKANYVNAARAGRSSRTFVTEGPWPRLLEQMKPGDFVLIQFGHNDGANVDVAPFRGSLPGIGEETKDVDNTITRTRETVHTYGWYLRKMAADVRAKGATPILLSLTVRNIWKDGKVERGAAQFGQWTRQVAQAQKLPFVDLTTIVADRYEQLGPAKVREFFPNDYVHTGPAGAALNANAVVAGLKALQLPELAALFSPAAANVQPAPAPTVLPGSPTPRRAAP